MRAACTASSWWRSRSAKASEAPRSRAISAGGKARVGNGRRARLPERPDGPGWKATCTSGTSAIARNTPAVARLNSSARVLSLLVPLIRALSRQAIGNQGAVPLPSLARSAGEGREGVPPVSQEIEFARTARRYPTDAERRLWSRLRRNAMGWHFRRQHPVPPFVLDFACLALSIAIEADGGQHNEPGEHDGAIGSLRNMVGWCCASGTMKYWPIRTGSSP